MTRFVAELGPLDQGRKSACLNLFPKPPGVPEPDAKCFAGCIADHGYRDIEKLKKCFLKCFAEDVKKKLKEWNAQIICCINMKTIVDPCSCGKKDGKEGPCYNPLDDKKGRPSGGAIRCQECCDYWACVKAFSEAGELKLKDILKEGFNWSKCNTCCT